MTTQHSNPASQGNTLFQALELLNLKEYQRALEILENLTTSTTTNIDTLIALGRCFLALDLTKDSLETYSKILAKNVNPTFRARAEAELLLDKMDGALSNFESALKYDPNDAEAQFLASIAAYKTGFISHAYKHLESAVSLGFDWDEEIPIDFIAQQVLPGVEFSDFEQIYLDVTDKIVEKKPGSQNRWFALNIPVLEFYMASKPEKKKKRTAHLAQLIDPFVPGNYFDICNDQLEFILKDFSSSQSDARFGLEALKLLNEKKYTEITKLILALQLEHLKEFAEHFALTKDRISELNLQNLIVLLPLPMATAMLFLYSSSVPEDQIQNVSPENIDENILTGLIALCFTTFYQQVKKYQNNTKKKA